MADSAPGPRRRTPRPTALTEADLQLLRFLAEHRFALAEHAGVVLGVTARTAHQRLGRLVDGAYVRRESVFSGQPPMHLITTSGLRAIASSLRTPRLDLHNYRHDIGLAWLWLAAERGTFGPVSEIVSERRMRSHDAGRGRDIEPFAVRLGGTGARGSERLHYPDLLLRAADGRRVALELELSGKERTRLETILAAYAADPRIAGVVYLVETQPVARSVERAARRVGAEDLVHLQRVRLTAPSPAAVAGLHPQRAAPGRRRTRSQARPRSTPEAAR